MASIDVNARNFEETVLADGVAIVHFGSPTTTPAVEAVVERYTAVTFARVDPDLEPVLAASLGVQSNPTLQAFRDGVLLFSRAGTLTNAELDDLIARVGALDMDQVHRDAAAHQMGDAGCCGHS